MIVTILLFILIVVLLLILFKLKTKRSYKISILIFTIFTLVVVIANSASYYSKVTDKKNIDNITLDINDENLLLYPNDRLEVKINKDGDKYYLFYGCIGYQRYLIKFNADLTSYDSYYDGNYSYVEGYKSITKDEFIKEIKSEAFNNDLNTLINNELLDDQTKLLYDNGNYIQIISHYFRDSK